MKLTIPICIFFITALNISCSHNNQTEDVKPQKTVQKKDSSQKIRTLSNYLSQDILLSFAKNADRIKSNKKASNPFDTLDYNKVIAYDYDGFKGESSIEIISNGIFASTIKQQKELNQKQVDELTRLLGNKSTYGGSKAFCFEPHLGIVFYKGDTIVSNIGICLECNHLYSSEEIPATHAKKIWIGKLSYPPMALVIWGSKNYHHSVNN